jgi:hypothetical protein
MNIIQREFDKALKSTTKGVIVTANTEMSTNRRRQGIHQNCNVTFQKNNTCDVNILCIIQT